MNRKNILAVGMSFLCLFGGNTIQIVANEAIPIPTQTAETSSMETNQENSASTTVEDSNQELPVSEEDGKGDSVIDEPESSEEDTNSGEELPLPDDEKEQENKPSTPSEEQNTPPAEEEGCASSTGGNSATSISQGNASASNSYVENTWYHPATVQDLGYTGETKNAIKLNDFITRNYSAFMEANNPFAVGQCTWLAWSRFYQVYGFDSGARGNGKTNAAEIVKAHPDLFQLSSTPSAGAVFSMEKNTLYPEYGHVGFVEAFDGKYIWISEGNVNGGLDFTGNIWIHKVSWAEFKAQYPDVVFAVPKETEENKKAVLESFLLYQNRVLEQCVTLANSHLCLKFR